MCLNTTSPHECPYIISLMLHVQYLHLGITMLYFHKIQRHHAQVRGALLLPTPKSSQSGAFDRPRPCGLTFSLIMSVPMCKTVLHYERALTLSNGINWIQNFSLTSLNHVQYLLLHSRRRPTSVTITSFSGIFNSHATPSVSAVGFWPRRRRIPCRTRVSRVIITSWHSHLLSSSIVHHLSSIFLI